MNKIKFNVRSLQENSLNPGKEKKCKVHVKKPAALLNIYYFTIIFLEILQGLKKSSGSHMFVKTGVL